MPSNKERAMEICLLYSYINFFLESKQITKEEASEITRQINENEVFLKHYLHEEKKQVSGLYESCDILNDMYKCILNYANNYDLFTINLPRNINIMKLMNYAKDFMRYLDNDILELFNKLLDNDLVYESDITDSGGKCFRLDGNTSAIIIRFNNIPFYKIFSLVHEMGHAYYHYLGKGSPNLIRSNLANECMPRIFEHLFIEYLRNNHLIEDETLSQYERFFYMHELSITNSVYIINKLLIDGEIDPLFNIEKTKLELPFEEYYDLSIIKPKNNDNQEFLGFNYNYYAYAYLLSMIIKEMFNKNELEARKFINEFPSYARNLTATELINMFDKTDYINATNKNISRVFSKKYYKK